MRKKFFNGKRVMALALALSLVVGEAGVAVAAPIDAEETVETVSANEAAEEVVAEEPAAAEDVVAEEVTTEEATEEPIEAETAFDGSVSKVIGLDGYSNFTNSAKDANGNQIYYSFVNQRTNSGYVAIAGTDPQQYYDAATGFYLVNGQYYEKGDFSAKKSHWEYNTSDYTSKWVVDELPLYIDADNALMVMPQITTMTDRFVSVNGKTYILWSSDDDANVLVPYYEVNSPVVPIATVTDYTAAEQYKKAKAKRFDGKAVDEKNGANYYDCDGRLFTGLNYDSNGSAGVVIYG